MIPFPEELAVRVNFKAGDPLVEIRAFDHPREKSVAEGLVEEHDSHDVGVTCLGCEGEEKDKEGQGCLEVERRKMESGLRVTRREIKEENVVI